MNPFKTFCKNHIPWDWRFGMVLVLLFGIPRFYLVLKANVTGDYGKVALIFLAMAVLPFILLNKSGRRQIGLQTPQTFSGMLLSLLIGAGFGVLVYLIGQALFGSSLQNWYFYISQSYRFPVENWKESRLMFFAIFAIISMTFSPIGEEIFYRGMVHESFAASIGHQKASLIDSLAFSTTHLSHFGIIWMGSGFQVSFISGFIWMGLIFLASRLFFKCRKLNQSIWGAMICHAGFNLAMIWTIFYFIL